MPVTVGGVAITPTQVTQLRSALGITDGDPVTARLASIVGTDDFIGFRAGEPNLVAASVIAAFTGGGGGVAPAAFVIGDWTLTPIAGGLRINVTTLPSDGGSAITALQYRLDGGSWVTMAGTGTGTRDVGSLSEVEYDVELRAVNAIGSGLASDIKSATPLPASAAAYLSETYTVSGGAAATTITRPAGAGASHTLTAIVFAINGGTTSLTTQAGPTGWTPVESVSSETTGSRVYTAPGDVAALTFNHPGASTAEGVLCFATTAPLRVSDMFGWYSGDNPGPDAPTPSVTAVAGDLGVSVYIQCNDGTGGAITGPITATWSSEYLKNDAVPRISVASKPSLTAGSTPEVSHGAVANYSNRLVFTGAYGT